MDSSKSSDGTTKKNLPLLRAVKEGKTSQIVSLLESGEVNVNFQNHCAPPGRLVGRSSAASAAQPSSLIATPRVAYAQMATRR